MNDNISLYLKIRQVIAYIIRAAKKYLSLNKTVYVQNRVGEYKQYWKSAAESLSLEFSEISRDIWEVKDQKNKVRFANFKAPINDPVTFHICADKALCYRFASDLGIPVPRHAVFHLSQMRDAKAYVEKHGGYYVVKPAYGTGSGQGVTTHVRTTGQLVEAVILASTYCNEFLVEQLVPAESCKLLFLNGELLHASRRRGVRVAGDGQASISHMLKSNEQAGLLDDNAMMTIAAQGLNVDSVIPEGVEVVVRALPKDESSFLELRTVYDESVTETVCQELINECLKIVETVGCELASVDLLTNDLGKSLVDSGGVFNEVNADPGIHHHYNNPADHDDSVAEVILKYLLSKS